ncbi:MAG: (2Fe-2S) ferredoxin domain-containing protein [Leptolyngbyaceae cyanobacterium HOT.MB2.61]|nr:(2Fe-2S) ferredoxin domain-containing protein [Leptolyngbyaceae cyanobacterium HOT.MB2.61]
MSKKDKQVSLFNLEGRFLGFIIEDGYKIKRLRLETAEGEYCIKLSKESRASVGRVLSQGDWLQVWGEKTIKDEGEVKFKAYRISVITLSQTPIAPHQTAPPQEKAHKAAKAAIMVCQKSDCMKRGGRAVCQALESALSDRGLADQVTIRGTGCMKHCKAGPNLVFMPDKTRYNQVSAAEIPTLVDRHFPTPPQASPSTLLENGRSADQGKPSTPLITR